MGEKGEVGMECGGEGRGGDGGLVQLFMCHGKAGSKTPKYRTGLELLRGEALKAKD